MKVIFTFEEHCFGWAFSRVFGGGTRETSIFPVRKKKHRLPLWLSLSIIKAISYLLVSDLLRQLLCIFPLLPSRRARQRVVRPFRMMEIYPWIETRALAESPSGGDDGVDRMNARRCRPETPTRTRWAEADVVVQGGGANRFLPKEDITCGGVKEVVNPFSTLTFFRCFKCPNGCLKP